MTIDLSHSAGGGGNFEQIALAAGLILLGLAFLVQKSLDRKVSVALVVLGLVAFIGSFTFLKNVGGADVIVVQGQEFTEEQLQDAVAAICLARETADNDADEAQVIFLDRAHVPLHAIAAGIDDDDRALSGRLLVAKQAVEEDFASDVAPERLVEDLEELLDVTVQALDVMQVPASSC